MPSPSRLKTVPRPTFESVDDYLAALPKPARAALDRVRATVKKALPRATEGISYQIPVYKLDGAMVLFFAGYARHYSIYPTTPALLRELGDELAPRLRNRTIRFSLDEPVPVRLITRIAEVRAAEVVEQLLAKAPKKKAAKTKAAKKKTAHPRSRAARKRR